jgi:hypothetical protein
LDRRFDWGSPRHYFQLYGLDARTATTSLRRAAKASLADISRFCSRGVTAQGLWGLFTSCSDNRAAAGAGSKVVNAPVRPRSPGAPVFCQQSCQLRRASLLGQGAAHGQPQTANSPLRRRSASWRARQRQRTNPALRCGRSPVSVGYAVSASTLTGTPVPLRMHRLAKTRRLHGC